MAFCRRDIYEDEIIALNEEIDHIRHVGARIIEERVGTYKMQNHLLKQQLEKHKVPMPKEIGTEDSDLTQSEKKKLDEYYAMKQKQAQ